MRRHTFIIRESHGEEAKREKVIVTENPSVAREFAKTLGVKGNNNGYIEDDKWIITWCRAHLVEMCYPEKYAPDLKKWSLGTLPFLPKEYKYEVISDAKDQFAVIKKSTTGRTLTASTMRATLRGKESISRSLSGGRQGQRQA